MEFLEFPEGDAFWCIKWIDGYRQAHGASRTTSVEILFQDLRISSRSEMNRFVDSEVATFLRRPYEGNPIYRRGRVHVGTLPALRIGQVFQSKTLVGTLPFKLETITLAKGDASGKSVTCAEQLEPPDGWTTSFRVLNPAQYDLPNDFGRSRCWLYRDESNKRIPVDIVVPRMLIEQTFYFPLTSIANAFARGPWSKIKHELICFEDTASGLKTQLDPITGEWHVILQTKVTDPFAPLMALFQFDDDASRFANTLYAMALIDRGNRHAPWYASGLIPLPAEEPPLRMKLCGYWLADIVRKGSRTFLATHIAGYDWPAAFPVIGSERVNSSAGSNQPQQNEGQRPYTGSNSSQRAPAGTQVSAQNDASTQYSSLFYEGMGIEHLRKPITRKLIKENHQQYSAPRQIAMEASDEMLASSGSDSSQNDASRKALFESLSMPGAVHFRHLLDSFEQLQAEGVIDQYRIFEPDEPSLRTNRQGIACWNFLDDLMRAKGYVPRRGWVALHPRGSKGAGNRLKVPRGALVLEITLNGRVAHWIEIERRPTECSMLSPVLLDVPPNMECLIIDYSLQVIASERGSGLRRAMPLVAAEYPPTYADCYQHAYEREIVDGKLAVKGIKTASLGNFLTRCFEASPSVDPVHDATRIS